MLLCFCLIQGQTSWANTPEDALNETKLEEGRTLALNRVAHLEVIRSYHQNYSQVRDQLVLGDTGISKLGEEWNRAALKWLEEWFSIQETLSLGKELTARQLDVVFSKKLRTQEYDLRTLKIKAEELNEKIKKALSRLESVPKPVAAVVSTDEKSPVSLGLESIISAETALRDKLKGLQNIFLERYHRVEAILGPSYSAAMNKMRLQTITPVRDELAKIVEKAEVLMRAAKELFPLIDNLAERNIEFMVSQSKEPGYFHVEKNYQEFSKVCDQVKVQLSEGKYPSGLIEGEKNKAERYCTSIARAIEERNRFSKAKWVDFHRSEMITKYQSRCMAGDARLNCEFYRIIARISPEQIQRMDDAHLKNYEMSWDLVDQSNLK
jgi:hypothetical protein